MTHRTVRRLSLVAAAATSLLGVAAALPTAALASPGTVTIDNTLPRWLGSASPTVSAESATPMTVKVHLAPRGGLAALQARVAAVSDPASPQYRRFITAQQYDATYAPSAAAVARVRQYLRGQGLTVGATEAHARWVEATGSRAALAKAFGTPLATYRHDGQDVVANTRAVTLPRDVGSAVLTVSGLDTTVHAMKHGPQAAPDVQPPSGFRNARPCNIDYGVLRSDNDATYGAPLPKFQGAYLPYAPCGYTGPSFRAAYEGGTDLDGTGATVAITDAYAWQLIAKDAEQYATGNGDGSYAPGQLTQNLPDTFTNRQACGPSGWSGEETLDVEAVHAMAPGATIRYYGSKSCFDDDFQETLARVVDEDKADIVTNSWSDVEENESGPSIASYEQVFMQGALQGISFFFSTGDSGDELARTGIRQVDYPASDPYVTGAGGTSTAISRGQLTGQTAWGTQNYGLSSDGKSWVGSGFLYGGGGGFSKLFNRPDYQQAKVPASSPAGRALPDISMDGDPNTGMLIGQTQAFPEGTHYGEYRIGGTSLSSPLLAGMTALAVQHSGKGFGLLNPALYRSKGLITDVLPGGMPDAGVVRVNFNNGVDNKDGISYFVRTFDQDSSLRTTRGWDDTTGLGVPRPSFLTGLGR